jgi:hypothetical protein
VVRLHHNPGSGLTESAGTLKRTDAPSARCAISSVRMQTWRGPPTSLAHDGLSKLAMSRLSALRILHAFSPGVGRLALGSSLTRKVEPVRALCGCTYAPRNRAVDVAGHSATRIVRVRQHQPLQVDPSGMGSACSRPR